MKKISFFSIICFINILIIVFCFSLSVKAQVNSLNTEKTKDSIQPKDASYFKSQKDLIDIFFTLLKKNADLRTDSTGNKNTKVYFSIAPVVEYTIATGFSPGIAGNMAFKTSVKQPTNTSSFLGAVKYTQKQQFILPIQSSIWTPGNKLNLLGDWRYLNYPQDTYGIGGYSTLNDKYTVTYQYMRLYEILLRKVKKNIYLGLGYQYDHYWNIKEEVQPGRITDFQKYGFRNVSTSSGVTFNVVYDSRENSIDPKGGSFYANLQYLQNTKILGATSNWNGITFDIRKYINAPLKTTLALWFYSVFILNGNPPYLNLPGTGSDTYNNTGRGYEQSRFIGKKMVDIEAELRFNISKNGLLGGVVFGNAESLSELVSNKFEVVMPGFGIGLRIKFNKFSGTNACLDYGIGSRGSRGFVGNLGEVF